jgi:Uma2 family endonuclease
MGASDSWTSADLELLPDNGKRYEIIDGGLYVSKPTHFRHQHACGEILMRLDRWSQQTRLGYANFGVGIVFSDTDDVVADVIWASRERLNQILGADGHLHAAPELVAEVLMPGRETERRDCEAKLKLYSRRGVGEYWIVNWEAQKIDVFRRESARLKFVATLRASDKLTSPLLPGFECEVREILNDPLRKLR